MMNSCISTKVSKPSARIGTASTPTPVPSIPGHDRLHVGVLRKLAVIVFVAIALSGLIPDTSARDVRKYSSPVGNEMARTQTDRIVQLLHLINKRRINQCVEAKRRCYSSRQCCSGHVCVVEDEYLANIPETPGLCFREKDLTLCTLSSECPTPGSRCMSLGRTGQRYCVTPPASAARRVIMTSPDTAVQQLSKSGGLGSACITSSECDERAYDGMTSMCCQLVHMHRQGSRQICDRYRPGVSVCV